MDRLGGPPGRERLLKTLYCLSFHQCATTLGAKVAQMFFYSVAQKAKRSSYTKRKHSRQWLFKSRPIRSHRCPTSRTLLPSSDSALIDSPKNKMKKVGGKKIPAANIFIVMGCESYLRPKKRISRQCGEED